MRKKLIGPAFGTLALAVGLCVFTPARAQSQKQAPSQQQEQSQQKNSTFVGQIVKASNGQYALLTDRDHGKGFFLDDQDKARQFVGRNVKVTGVLEASTSTIHVTDIQPA